MNTGATPLARSTVLRPRDAATLLVLRHDRDAVRVLMGERSARHIFHPGSVVFPGGRVSRQDSLAPAHDDLRPEDAARLEVRTRSPARARAIALAAIRETFEEVGVVIGVPGQPPPRRSVPAQWQPFFGTGFVPTLAPLRFLARAVTPPGGVRRFDARFLAVFAESIGKVCAPEDDELIAPAWLTLDEAEDRKLPYITRVVIRALRERLKTDPRLEAPLPVALYHMRHGRRVEEFF